MLRSDPILFLVYHLRSNWRLSRCLQRSVSMATFFFLGVGVTRAVTAVAAEPLSQLDEHPEDVVLLFAEEAGRRHKVELALAAFTAVEAATAPADAATAAAAARHVSACFKRAADSCPSGGILGRLSEELWEPSPLTMQVVLSVMPIWSL